MAINDPFVWGAGGQRLTPEQVAVLRELEIRKQLRGPDTSPVADWTQGAARVVDALGGVLREKRYNAADAANRAADAPLISEFSNYLTGGTQVPMSGAGAELSTSSPTPQTASAPSSSFDPSAVAPEIKTGIVETANALGIAPADLATAISYETGGTFDPTKTGPTTQWGTHRGLIQFGEPQAKQYGVDWTNPVGSQLGANGAIANYLKSTGVKPGAGLMDIYSAINAGGVGRYNASDERNGGAPGTVADKVNTQMAGHRANALALLGDASQMAPPLIPVQRGELPPVAAPLQDYAQAQSPTVPVRGGRLGTPFNDDRFGPVDPQVTNASLQQPQQSPFMPEIAGMSGVQAPPDMTTAVAPQMAAASPQPSPVVAPQQVAQAAPPSRVNTQVLARAIKTMNDPYAGEQVKGIAKIVATNIMAQQQAEREAAIQAADPLRQAQLAEAQRNLRTPKTVTVNGTVLDAETMRPLYTAPEQTPESVRALNARASAAGLVPGTPAYQQFMVSGGSQANRTEPAPSPGMKFVRDPVSQEILYEEPIKGSPADKANQAADEKAATTAESQATATDVVTNAASRARQAYNAGGILSPVTGRAGELAAWADPTSNAAELRRQIDAIKATATIESLNAMRAASPTGGALGNVTEGEGRMLAAKAGSLDPNSKDFPQQLDDYERTLYRVIYHSNEQGDSIFKSTRPKQNEPNKTSTGVTWKVNQ